MYLVAFNFPFSKMPLAIDYGENFEGQSDIFELCFLVLKTAGA
jgi:hypothetical protein